MDSFVQWSQLLLILSILIILHELGHFLPAKYFKCRVEKFYLFFNPYFSLWKKKIGETVYGIGWLPLGGYVKIAGMIDESMDSESLNRPAEPWEFRAKPAWQRLIIMLGGVFVNFVLAGLLFWGVTYKWGHETIPMESLKYGVSCDSTMESYGFVDGDRIISADSDTIHGFEELTKVALLNDPSSFTVLRDGKTVNVNVDEDFALNLIRSQKVGGGFGIRFRSIVDSVLADSPADSVGLIKGDHIVAINGKSTVFFRDLRRQLKSEKGNVVTLSVLRNGDTVTVKPKLSAQGTVGFYPNDSSAVQKATLTFGFWEAFPEGIKSAVESVRLQAKTLVYLLNPSTKVYEDIHSPIAFAKAMDTKWNWRVFFSSMAYFSAILGFMNVLPIPALDGGHAMFLVYEIIVRRKPSQRFMEIAQMTGMALLLGLMLLAFGNDIFR